MTANIEIVTRKQENILVVPHAALKFVPENHSQKYNTQGIWVMRNGKLYRINIETGISDDFNTEITSEELQDGDVVIIGTDGDNTKKQSRRNMPPPM